MPVYDRAASCTISKSGGENSNFSTGAPGTDLLAYTATFGNGFTATLAIEDAAKRRNSVWDAGTDALTIGATPGPSVVANLVTGGGATSNAVGDYGAVQVPDIVGSLRVDQAWGSAQIAGALHQVRGGFYGNRDIRYLYAPISRGYGPVLVVQAKMPTFPQTYRGARRMGTGQVRFWSAPAVS